MPKRFFKTAQDRRFVLGFKKDYLLFGQSRLCQCRREQISLRIAPQDLSPRACRDPGGEGGRRRAIYRSIGATGDLVKRPECKPALG